MEAEVAWQQVPHSLPHSPQLSQAPQVLRIRRSRRRRPARAAGDEPVRKSGRSRPRIGRSFHSASPPQPPSRRIRSNRTTTKNSTAQGREPHHSTHRLFSFFAPSNSRRSREGRFPVERRMVRQQGLGWMIRKSDRMIPLHFFLPTDRRVFLSISRYRQKIPKNQANRHNPAISGGSSWLSRIQQRSGLHRGEWLGHWHAYSHHQERGHPWL